MKMEDIYQAVKEQLFLDIPKDDMSGWRSHQARVDAVVGILPFRPDQVPERKKESYISMVSVGVNDLMTMQSSGGGFSPGFLYLVNSIRFSAEDLENE